MDEDTRNSHEALSAKSEKRILSFAPCAAAVSILETLPRTNCTSLDTSALTCRGALRTATRSASNPCLARIPSSLASQRGVPDADTPEYATLICSAFAEEVSSATATIIHQLLSNMVILLGARVSGRSTTAGLECQVYIVRTLELIQNLPINRIYDFSVLLKWSMVRCQASFAASGS